MTTESPASHRCRACGADVPEGSLRCPRCNAAQGPQAPCPHCRAEAGASLDAELRYKCDVCGGPRVPKLDSSLRYSGKENALLRKADAARKSRAAYRAGAVTSGILLPIALAFFGLLMLIFGLKIILLLAMMVVVGPLIGALAMTLGRARDRGREIPPAIDAAWVAVASDIAQQTRGGPSVELFTKKLGIEEAQAEELLALLDVSDAIGNARYRFAEPLAPAPIAGAGSAPGNTQVAAAEEEAAIEEAAGAAAAAPVKTLGGPDKP